VTLRCVELRQTGDACPSQWEGVLDDGRAVYIRYRFGLLAVGVGAALDDAVLMCMDAPLLDLAISDHYDGVMTTEEMAEHVRSVLEVTPRTHAVAAKGFDVRAVWRLIDTPRMKLYRVDTLSRYPTIDFTGVSSTDGLFVDAQTGPCGVARIAFPMPGDAVWTLAAWAEKSCILVLLYVDDGDGATIVWPGEVEP
jgi:hypothetical protein